MHVINRARVACVAIGILYVGAPEPARPYVAPACPALGPADQQRLVAVVTRYRALPPASDLHIASETVVAGTCFKKLRFESSRLGPAAAITMYLSPDGHYLSDNLIRADLDSTEEINETRARVEASSLSGEAPARGETPSNSKTTIVVFADFACPFCKDQSEVLHSFLGQNPKTRILFRHLPLPSHVWAMDAARMMACIQSESTDVFWKVHDQIYAHQESITRAGLRGLIRSAALETGHIDKDRYDTCIAHGLSDTLIATDVQLASDLNITATPTLVINGHVYVGLLDYSHLAAAVGEAAQQKPVGGPSSKPATAP